jgi:hypothetical protein
MSHILGLSHLPTELLLYVAEFLSIQDLSSFSRLSRQFHWRLFHPLFHAALAKTSGSSGSVQCLMDLFFHAVKHNSMNIAQYLIYSTDQIDFNGYDIVPLSAYARLTERVRPLQLHMSSSIVEQYRLALCASLQISPSSILPYWPTHRELQYS